MAEPAVLKELSEPDRPQLRVVTSPPRRPEPRLEVPSYDFRAALALERELGVSRVLAQILVRRGMPDAAVARAFLDAAERHEPDRLAGIENAVTTVARHIANGTRITVHGDYDVDGICATAVLVRALRSLGANVGWFLPSREHDGYGLSPRTIDRLRELGTELLMTVDCGVTAVDEVAYARATGLDVVVTDHHTPRADGALPDCPIVHPAIGGYPCPHLCGTGVAFKLAQALEAPTANEDIELVALATVADLVPLEGENRRLVREGLRQLAGTAKPGLRALMAVARTDPSAVDAHALGFRLGPRINAAGRLRRADAGLELLLTEDEQRASEIAAELDALNAERRAVEERTAWDAEAQVAELGERSAYVLAGEGWHPGVIGIVASRIVERYHRPTVMIALEGDTARGSGRSIPGFDLVGALDAVADHLESYGGHRAAAGLTIAPGRVASLAEAFDRYARAQLTPEMLERVERVDAIASGAELGLALAEELRALEPCGIGNPAARLLIPGARFTNRRALGDGGHHASFSVLSGRALAKAVAFGCDGRLPGSEDDPLDATFKLERDTWRGTISPRLVLRQAQPCSPPAIEVLGESEPYMDGVMAELDAPLEALQAGAPIAGRTTLERHAESPLAVLADAVATGDRVLAVCADLPRRMGGLRSRSGGFALISYPALERDPATAQPYTHLVALDPPATAASGALLRAGCGFTHLCWSDAELRFAWQIYELEYGLRASLAAVYRGLKVRGTVAGEELEHLLRGDGQHGRPARVAGRLVRILSELELVSLDRNLLSLAIVSDESTTLESSPAYQAYRQRYEDGRRFLSSANPQPRSD